MYSRSPSDGDSCDDSVHRLANTDCDVEPVDRTSDSGISHIAREESDLDQGPSVLQMAFLQLMTQKVIEATANCPEVLEQLNSNIRTDKD